MIILNDVLQFLTDLLWAALPNVHDWSDLTPGKKVGEIVKLLLQLGGLWEIGKFVVRLVFKRRTALEQRLEILEADKVEYRATIESLRASIADATARLPETAIKRADREWRDLNEDSAIRELDGWLEANAAMIGTIALRSAKYHISRTIPDPRDHLDKAGSRLRLACEACPDNAEARDLWSELDVINAGLQEQLIVSGNTQIAWNTEMADRLHEKGTAQVPVIQTLMDVAGVCFAEGKRRLAPVFADRAATLARSGGRLLKPIWVSAESAAGFYHAYEGRAAEGLRRIESALDDGRTIMEARDLRLLTARRKRAWVLCDLGRPADALAEIDTFGPIEAEVSGRRHPNVLATHYLRALMLRALGRSGDALAEIEVFAPILAEVRGARHPEVLTARHLRASVLQNLGRPGEALAEIAAFGPIMTEVLGMRHPDVLSIRYLRASVLRDLGRRGEAMAEIDAFGLLHAEVKGVRHPDVLGTRHLRASVLQDLGRPGEALAEIDAFGSIEAEVRGVRHPNVLSTRRFRASVLQDLGRPGEALAEIDAVGPILAEVTGVRHPDMLTNHHQRASILADLERWDDAFCEIEAVEKLRSEIIGPRHWRTLNSRSLRFGIEIATNRVADREADLRALIDELTGSIGPSARPTLVARYRLARLLFQQGRADTARTEIESVIAGFDPQTDPDHIVLRPARTLRDMIDGRPSNGRLMV